MMKRALLAASLVAALGAGVSATASADVFVRVAPPPPREEVVPAERHGYVWAPGYWDWRGHRYVWVSGHYVRARSGYVYMGPRWVEHNGGWRMERGHWGHGDRDHDGVPNRVDRDRDGDGVPNRFDRHPDNPRRN